MTAPLLLLCFDASSGDGSCRVASSTFAQTSVSNAPATSFRPLFHLPHPSHRVRGMHPIPALNNNEALRDVAGTLATVNHARARPKHIPRHTSNGYMDYTADRMTALRTAIHHLEEELGLRSTVSRISLETDRLTLHPHNSQSKLSQQELSDLQKATHFDKKELQQWYKGMSCEMRWTGNRLV